jgi:prevent-host-death family protein
MKKLNVSEARQHLPSLVDDVAESGEEVLITRRGQPLARLVPFRPANAGQGTPSLRELPIKVADDFDAPLPELWEALDE